MAPVARLLVELYLDAPYVDAAAGVGRDSETPADLLALLDAVGPTVEDGHPLVLKLRLTRLMRAVEAASTTAYAETMQAHAMLIQRSAAAAPGARDPKTIEAAAGARARRTAAAIRVVTAWRNFDRALRAAPELGRSPEILAVFRLNDTLH